MPRISFGFTTLLDFSSAGLTPSNQDDASTLGLNFELAAGQGPTQFTIKPVEGFRFSLDKVLDALASILKIDALSKVAQLTSQKPWSLIFQTEISPELSVLVSSSESVVQCMLTLYEQGSSTPGVHIGGQYGPITIEPNFTVFNLIIGYNSKKGGLDVSAKVKFDDQSGSTWLKAGDAPPTKTEVVKFPFPVPDQGTPLFRLNYLGLGQRFGPPLPTNVNDFSTALETIFTDLEKNLTTNDPQTILEKLVKNYYHPDRDWFVAADVEVQGWQVRLLFNDPVLYGLQVTCSVAAFKGLELIILYEKLGPHLGVYYGKLTIPEQYRQINLGAVALTLPTIQIWIYTNGDFKVNVGWPLGSDSIGIQVYIFTGGCGFYFGKLRSGDNPQTKDAAIQYNPILVFGLGLWLGVGRSFSKGPLSASLSLTVQGTFQGILAWEEGNPTSAPPDYFWFAATVGLVGTLQGEVDLKIIKISLLVRLTATAGIAFETDYNAVLEVRASVEVKASVKVLFIKISVSFSADVSQTFVLSHGGAGDASLNGPKNPNFKNLGGGDSDTAPMLRAMQRGRYIEVSEAIRALDDPAVIDLSFVLYPAATYAAGNGQSQATALLMMSAPEYGNTPNTGDKTAWELLIDAYAGWLLANFSNSTNSWEAVLEQLNNPPQDFDTQLVESFLATDVSFSISGVDLTQQNESAAANMVFFPILPNLQMQVQGDNGFVNFDQPEVSADFLSDLSAYADLFSLSALMSNAPESSGATLRGLDALGGNEVSLNSLLFTDYFLMIGQQLAQQMMDEAPQDAVPGVEIAANVAGFVSRFLLNGLVAPSPEDNTKWSGLYQITGQQFAVNTENNANTSANLLVNGAYQPIGGQPDFSKLKIEIGTEAAVIPVAVAPAQPDTLPGNISLVAPLSPIPLWVSVRNRLSWTASGQPAQFIVPLPNRIQQLLGSQALSLTVQTSYPSPSQSGDVLAAVPALLIGICLFQIKQTDLFNIDEQGQTAGSYLPFVYTIGGTDEETRDRMEALLNANALSGVSISLLYNAPDSGYLSDAQNPQATFLVKTNLSTSSEPNSLYDSLRFRSMARSLDDTLGPVSALQSNAADFLRIVWENSVVNSGGFFLYYNNAQNQDLPASIFKGGQADLQILVSFPANTVYQNWHNAFAIPAANVTNALYIGPNVNGTPIQEYQASYPTGCIAFEALPATRLFAEAADDPTLPPYSEESIAQLYHLLQYQIAANLAQALDASGWSPSISPNQQQNGGQSATDATGEAVAGEVSENSYRQVAPVYNFIPAAQPSSSNPLPDIYAAIGAQSKLQLRMADVYGNTLDAASQSLPFEVQYTDAIWSLAEWPGVSVDYRIRLGNNGAPAVTLDIRFDPNLVLRNFGANAYVVEKLKTGEAPQNAEDLQQQAQIALYKLYYILHQLNDPHCHWQVSTTLFAGASGDTKGKVIASDSALKPPMTDFAGKIVQEVNKVFGSGTPLPLTLNLDLPITPADIAQTPGSILPISVWMDVYRDGFLPDHASEMPNLASNAFVVKPYSTTDASNPSSNLTAFAQDFETVFTGFDGANGLVKLASRTGNADFSAADASAYLWAVKWSDTKGISLKFAQSGFVYYTLSPLSNQLLPNEQAQITVYDEQLKPDTSTRTFTNIDVDAYAIDFLNSVDELLDPELAAAMAKADSGNYASIMSSKANLAGALKKGLIPVFEGQEGEANSAMDSFEQALLSKLATAYTVSAVVQTPVQVQDNGGQSNQQPRLFGSISAADGNVNARDYTLTNAKLELDPNGVAQSASYLSFLATARHPQSQADLELDLNYNPVFIEHLLQNDQTDYGYTPSSWLRYVLVDNTAQPTAFGLGTANIPVPLRQYPQSPVLESQAAKGTGDTLNGNSNPVEDALKWNYQAAVVPSALNAQDELWFDLIYNLPVTNLNDLAKLKAGVSPLVALFQSLAAFNAAYGSLRSLLLQDADTALRGPAPASLSTIIGILAPLIQEAATAYANYMDGIGSRDLRMGDPPSVIRRHFVLSFKQIATKTLTLYGDSADLAEYPAKINGAAPNGNKPTPVQNGPDQGTWYELLYSYSPDSAEPNRLTALWSDIDAVTRQTALTEYWIVRNSDLGAGNLTVDSRLVYTTAKLAFANPILPLVRISNIQATTQPALSDTLQGILAPFLQAGSASVGNRLLKLESSYAYNLLDLTSTGANTGGQQIWIPASVNLVDDLYLSVDGGSGAISLADFACDMAKQLDTWHKANKPLNAPAKLTAQLSFNITLFAVIDQSNLPLISAENIYVAAPASSAGWWNTICK